ncbi:hypothetical protein E1258_13280 [Micromonospora sp. KC207]|uniref:Tn3 family transposase n=1 Tax=Micromonospora sp. KC207 TaxID=2530377 RepID=UPI0010477C5D|nr:Tn3 family transposase [Micromonospora sp. KC207]TDC60887.1 hypothetical protein E1258_13280 [Micromonospora sp. KC207]
MLQRDGRPSQLGDAFAMYGRIFKTLHVLTFVDDSAYRRGRDDRRQPGGQLRDVGNQFPQPTLPWIWPACTPPRALPLARFSFFIGIRAPLIDARQPSGPIRTGGIGRAERGIGRA